jgi:diguanylate cyclase (GGDEF)-like protein
MLASLNSELSFTGLTFSPDVIAAPESASHFVRDAGGKALGSFSWQSRALGNSIWPTVIPIVLTLSLLLATLAFGIAWRIGRLTSSLQASERQNRHLALHDTLSGLANRLQFNRVLKAATRDLPASPFAIIHCDLDKFKSVNDTHGHAAGDKVIKTVAERMTEIVGKGGLVARLGGDEFVILYRSFTDHGRLTLLSGQLMGAVEAPIPLENGEMAEVGLSIGIVTAPECGSTPEGLMAAADDALYYSKENGRGQAAFARDLKQLFAMSVSGSGDDHTSDAA